MDLFVLSLLISIMHNALPFNKAIDILIMHVVQLFKLLNPLYPSLLEIILHLIKHTAQTDHDRVRRALGCSSFNIFEDVQIILVEVIILDGSLSVGQARVNALGIQVAVGALGSLDVLHVLNSLFITFLSLQ